MADLEERVDAIERWRADLSVSIAVDSERRRHMDDRFDRVDTRLAKIEGAFTKVLWAVGLIVLGQLAKFILEGGIG